MGVIPAMPDKHIAEKGGVGNFGLGKDTLRVRLGERDFKVHDNLECEDKNLTRRFPERFLAKPSSLLIDFMKRRYAPCFQMGRTHLNRIRHSFQECQMFHNLVMVSGVAITLKNSGKIIFESWR